MVRKVLSEPDLFLKCIVGVIEGFGDAERLFCATNVVYEWFEKLSRMAAIKTEPQYNSHPWVGPVDQKVERKVFRTVTEICKKFKGDTIKELVCYFHRSIVIMKLAMLDEMIREYLLYSLISMQYAMGKQLTFLDAFLTRTKSNEDWT